MATSAIATGSMSATSATATSASTITTTMIDKELEYFERGVEVLEAHAPPDQPVFTDAPALG